MVTKNIKTLIIKVLINYLFSIIDVISFYINYLIMKWI